MKPRLAVFALAAVLTAATAYDLWRTPIQVWDAIEELMDAQRSPSIAASFEAGVGTTAYLRPLRIAQIKALFDASAGHYQVAYRGFHAALLICLVLLFARALRAESWRDAAAAAFALTVLMGMHTFLGFLREAFPINHFLEIAVFTLAALNLSISRGGWWADVLAAVVFAAAALTLESGVLVWVVLVAAWICGLRGVSSRGVAAVTVLLGGYFALRFAYLHTGLPELDERTSGFLLDRLGPRDVQARFGARPFVFYAYNLAASALSVLLSEPRDGQFVALRAWLQHDVHPAAWLAITTSLGTTASIVWWSIAAWRRREFGHAERLAVVALAVGGANVVLSYAYAKDDIVAVAGVFYALAAYAAVRGALGVLPDARVGRALLASLLLAGLACGWAVRSSGVHYVVSSHAFRIRNDWARAPLAMEEQHRSPADVRARALIETLRRDALDADVPNPLLAPDWKERWYGN